MYGFDPKKNWNFLIGKILLQICLSPYQIILRLDESNQWASISIQGAFDVEENNRIVEYIGILDSAKNLFSFFESKIIAVNVRSCKKLEIKFSNNSTIVLFDDSEFYESFVFVDESSDSRIIV